MSNFWFKFFFMTHTFNWQKLKIPFDYSISFRCKDGIETIKHNCFGKQQCAVTFGIISITVLFFFLFLQKLMKNLSIVSLFKKYIIYKLFYLPPGNQNIGLRSWENYLLNWPGDVYYTNISLIGVACYFIMVGEL